MDEEAQEKRDTRSELTADRAMVARLRERLQGMPIGHAAEAEQIAAAVHSIVMAGQALDDRERALLQSGQA